MEQGSSIDIVGKSLYFTTTAYEVRRVCRWSKDSRRPIKLIRYTNKDLTLWQYLFGQKLNGVIDEDIFWEDLYQYLFFAKLSI